MSDVDPTPETPVTVGDRMGWFRADVQAQLALLRGLPAADLAQLLTAINLVRGVEPAGDLGQLVSGLESLQGVGTHNTLAAIGTLLSIFRSEYLIENGYLKDGVLGIYSSIGIPTGDATTTVLGHLAAIERLLTVQTSGLPPIVTPDDISSVGNLVSDGRRFARFSPPIPGLTVSSDTITLTPTGSWSGWQVYVQSNAPNCYIGSATDVCNAWLSLAGTGSLTFSVDAQYQISVSLRSPASETFTSELVAQPGTGTLFQVIVWPAPIVATGQNPFNPNLNYNKPIYRSGNFSGRRITVISGTSVRVELYNGGSPTTLTVGSQLVIPSATQYIAIYSTVNNTTFTVQLSV